MKMTRRKDSKYFIDTLGVKSYGTIIFGRNQTNRANFIRVPSNASPGYVKQLLVRKCQNKRPSLVISIAGSTREYNMKSKLFRVLRQGLLKVAKTTDVWIITGGVNTSITKLIGEIIRTNPDPSRPIHLIGIASWGCIAGVEQLDVHGTNVVYDKTKLNQTNETILEPNHTQFVFIDDGTTHKLGAEFQFRSKFEKSIAQEEFISQFPSDRNLNDDKHSSCSSSYSFPEGIPVVLVVIDGGRDTIKKVHESVTEHNIPVVLLEGTDGCCDLFAKCSRLYQEYHPRTRTSTQINLDRSLEFERNEQMKTKIYEKLNFIHLEINECPLEIEYFRLIYECIESRKIFLNFVDFKVHSNLQRDIDLAILQALLNATTSTEMNVEQKREQLNLAFEWNRVDIVKDIIMKDEQDWSQINLNDLFYRALLRNQTNFVQLFLDHDFMLMNLFQNPKQILALYQDQNFLFKHCSNDPLRSIYKNIIQPMIGPSFEVDAIFSTGDYSSNDEGHEIYLHSKNLDVEKELFLWSVLTGKQELALLFWSRGRNKVCAALIATLLYKSQARKKKNSKYNNWADQFENLAVEILEKFYRKYPSDCTKAIIREIPQFGNVTWLHLAVMAEAKLFIAQPAVQNVLSSIWFGYIDRRVGKRRVIFASFMIWYSGFLSYHDEMVEIDENRHFDENSDHVTSFIQHDVPQSKYVKTTDRIENGEELVNLQSNRRPPSYWTKVSKFFDAPYVKYLYNLYSHVIFLLLFSYVILCDFHPLYETQRSKCRGTDDDIDGDSSRFQNTTEEPMKIANFSMNATPHWHPRVAKTEFILIIWMITIFFEEIRQIFAMEFTTVWWKIRGYFSIFWNKLDFLSVLLFFIAIVLRFCHSSECFCTARILLAIDLSIWFIRTLDIFSAVKQLGPKLVMIGEMVHDLTFFMIMLTVFILAFGVPACSLLRDVDKFTPDLPRRILNIAYWQIFGELAILDEIEINYQLSGYVVFFLLISYMTVASVLLMNLLIAMLSNTFDRLQADTDCIWKFQHYSLVCYHLTRPCLPPPLIIFAHLSRCCLVIFGKYFKIDWIKQKYIQMKNREKFRIATDAEVTRTIEAIEDALGNEIYYFFSKSERKQIDHQKDYDDERIHSPQEIVMNKIKTLDHQMRTIQYRQDDMFAYLECLMNGMKKLGGDDIEMPKRTRNDSELF